MDLALSLKKLPMKNFNAIILIIGKVVNIDNVDPKD